MEIKIAALLFLAAVDLFFGLFVYLSNKRSPINIFYGLAVLSVGLWSLGVFMFFFSEASTLRFWSNFTYLAGSLIVGNFFAFSLIFPKEEWGRGFWRTAFLYLPNIFFVTALFFSNLIIKEVLIFPNGTRAILFGSLYFLYWLYFLVFLSSAFIILARRYFRAGGVERLQIGYVLVGSFILAAFGTLMNLWLPTVGIFDLFWLGPYFSMFLVTLLATAIFKYRLFNIRLISAEIFVALLIIVLFVNFFVSAGITAYLFNGIILLGGVVFGYFLIRGVINEIQAREEISRLAEGLNKANQELKKLDQLKSEFLSLASHQLRAPLPLVKGYISMIQEGNYGEIPEKLREALRRVYFSNERLINLVGDFLNISRIESGRLHYVFEPSIIADLIRSVVGEFKDFAKDKGIELSCQEPKETLPLARIDRDKFRQVIVNLIDNAIKYTRRGSIKIEISSDKDSILISTQDTGIGMAPEELDLIFKRFSRGEGATKVYTEGMGLGLYLAKRIVQDHGGEIWAESKGRGRGSTFYIKIPALTAEVKRAEQFKEFVEKI